MKRVIVIGSPGSGKSTFAKKLHKATALPLFHLDMLYWNADKTTVEKPVFRQRLDQVLRREEWILDGNYASTMEMRLAACDTVFFLDYPTEVCLSGVRQRQGKPRSDIPWTDTEDDPEFLRFIEAFQEESRPKILALLETYGHKEIHIFKSRDEADTYIKGTV